MLVTVLGLTACGHAGETDPDLDGTAALDCLAEKADGALSDRDREILSGGFKFDAVNAQVSARSADDLTEGATDYFPDPDLDEQDDGEAAPFVPQTMSAFDSLQLERDDAEAVYAAATECGTEFAAMMSRQALAVMPSALADTPEAAACVKKAVTEETVAEYVIAVLGKSEPSEYGSKYGLWRALHACTPRTTLATAPDTGPAEEPLTAAF